MNFDVMMVFDVIIIALGLYLFAQSIIGLKNKTVPSTVVPAEDMARCKDEAAMSAYLLPKVIIFAVMCFACGVQGLINDTKLVEMPKMVNTGFLILFLAGWSIFSYCIVKARKKYLH